MAGKGRGAGVLVLLAAALAAVVVLAIGAGAVKVPPVSVLRLLAYHLGFHGVGLPSQQETAIILLIRLPRVVAGVLVGAALAVGGAVMQGLFRNPMASPDILGVSTGGSLGAVVAIVGGLAAVSPVFLPLLAIAGALSAAFLIYAIASYRGRTSLLFVVLAGLAISSFFNGLVSALLMLARQWEVSQFIFWTMGGLDGRTWQQVLLALPFLVPGLAVLFFYARELNLFSLGEEEAQSVGLAVERTKRVLLAVTAVGGRGGHLGQRPGGLPRPAHPAPVPPPGGAGPPPAPARLGAGRRAVPGGLRPDRARSGPALRDPGRHPHRDPGQPVLPVPDPARPAQGAGSWLRPAGRGRSCCARRGSPTASSATRSCGA